MFSRLLFVFAVVFGVAFAQREPLMREERPTPEELDRMVDRAAKIIQTDEFWSFVGQRPGESIGPRGFPIRPMNLPPLDLSIGSNSEKNESRASSSTRATLTTPWPNSKSGRSESNREGVSPDGVDSLEEGQEGSGFGIEAIPDYFSGILGGIEMRLDVLANDGDRDVWLDGVCTAVDTPTRPRDVLDGFAEISKGAGLSDFVQKEDKTSPNCLFPYYDAKTKRWDEGSFCLIELITGGSAIGDFDNDGWQDLFLTRMDNYSVLLRNEGCEDGALSCAEPRFRDVTKERGLPHLDEHWEKVGVDGYIRGNGARFVDVDGDGDLDLYVSTVGERRFYFWENDGMGYFVEKAVEMGLDMPRRQPSEYMLLQSVKRPKSEHGHGPPTAGFTIAAADSNGDTLPEIYTTEWFPRMEVEVDFVDVDRFPNLRRGLPNEMSTSRFVRNRGVQGPGEFEEATSKAGIAAKSPHMAAGNTQGLLKHVATVLQESGIRDETIVHGYLEAMAQIIVNESLTETADKNSVTTPEQEKMIELFRARPNHFMMFGFSGIIEFGATFSDIDLDGFADLVLSGDYGTSQLYVNTGDKETFRPQFMDLILDDKDNSMGCAVGDFDNDGMPDILFTSISLLEFLRNEQFGSLFATFENAGLPSSFLGNRVYRGLGDRTFEDRTDATGLGNAGWAWGGSLVDVDNDGDLDVVIVNGFDDPETTDDDYATRQPARLFLNELIPQHTTDASSAPTEDHVPSSRKQRRQQRRSDRGKPETMFTESAATYGIDDHGDGRALAVADFGRDGRMDVQIVNHGEQPRLYVGRQSGDPSWIRVDVVEPVFVDMLRLGIVAGAASSIATNQRRAKEPLTLQDFHRSLRSFFYSVAKSMTCFSNSIMDELRDAFYHDLPIESLPDNIDWTSPSAATDLLAAILPHAVSKRTRISNGARVWASSPLPSSSFTVPHVYADNGTQFREIGSGTAFMGQSESTAHFGLGPGVSRVRRVTVHWPHFDASRTFWGIPAKRTIRVTPPLSAVAFFGVKLILESCPETNFDSRARRALVAVSHGFATGRRIGLFSNAEPRHTIWSTPTSPPPCESLAITSTTQPEFGHVTIDPTGNFLRFQPPSLDNSANIPENQTFTYTVTDRQGTTSETTVTIRLE